MKQKQCFKTCKRWLAMCDLVCSLNDKYVLALKENLELKRQTSTTMRRNVKTCLNECWSKALSATMEEYVLAGHEYLKLVRNALEAQDESRNSAGNGDIL